MINKLDATFRFYQDAANLRAHRQQLIASNIANVDTPNFKARDINFKARWKVPAGTGLSNWQHMPRIILRRQEVAAASRMPVRPCMYRAAHTGKRGWQYGRYGYRAQPVCRQRYSL